jgi:hypothetical protein
LGEKIKGRLTGIVGKKPPPSPPPVKDAIIPSITVSLLAGKVTPAAFLLCILPLTNENIYFENYYNEQRKFTNDSYSM